MEMESILEDSELSAMAYRDLQKVAKRYGVKANLPKRALIKEIKLMQSKGSSPPPPEQVQPSVTVKVESIEKGKENSSRRSSKVGCFLDFVSKRRERRRALSPPEIEVSTPKRTRVLSPLAPNTPKENNINLNIASSAKRSSTKNSVRKSQSLKPTPSVRSSQTVSKKKEVSRIPRCKMPDFAKLHAREFDKMENLETYLNKRKITPSQRRASPRITKMDEKKIKSGVSSHSKSVTSLSHTSAWNTQVPTSFQFGSTQKKQPVFTFSATPNKSCLMNNSEVKKNNFDLKQSLAQPLKYKPHTGKLKTWEEKKNDRKAAFKSQGKGSSKGTKSVIIKGVRMNRRAELMLQRRRVS